jgi:hypothetical protein
VVGRYDNPIPTRFLAPIDCSKIPAQTSLEKYKMGHISKEVANTLLPAQKNIKKQEIVGKCGISRTGVDDDQIVSFEFYIQYISVFFADRPPTVRVLTNHLKCVCSAWVPDHPTNIVR